MSEVTAISFEVCGVPAPQGSKRAFTRNGKAWLDDVNADKLKPWRAVVNSAAADAMKGMPLITGPTHIQVEFRFPRPKGHFGSGKNSTRLKDNAPTFKESKPDCDKLLRAIFDALTGVVWKDDAQVADVVATKLYCDRPGCFISVSTLKGASDGNDD